MRLYGKNPVLERLKSNPRGIKKIYIQNGHPDAGYVYKKAQKWGLPIYAVPETKIRKIAAFRYAGFLVPIGLPYEIASFVQLCFFGQIHCTRSGY